MELRCAEEMQPQEILAARDRSGCAFVPVSPAFEWHSWQLPVGTDALIAESVARELAELAGGIWFRPLSFGLDMWRTPEELSAWGFGAGEPIFGMRFPDLPLSSEYCEQPELRAAVCNRLSAVRDTGFGHVFLINHHGGAGQWPALADVARENSTETFHVHYCPTGRFNDVGDESLRVGGHAGLSETTWLMAFRPELVDLASLPEGELEVRTSGILHRQPIIEAQYNPRNASANVARALRRRVVQNMADFVRQALSGPEEQPKDT